MATVTLDRLTKRYDRASAPAVDAVSLDVADGEFMVLLGPSGCGKTTTLRMVAGLESITDGRLSIDGVAMNAVPARDRDIAMVFQSYALYPHMTVARNLAFGLERRNLPRAEIDARVRAVAAKIGLEPYLDRRPHALSGGQRQRVALGRAIVREPKVFLFDEPLSNLDAALRASTRSEITRLHRELGATMIYVTHDQVEAMTMGSRICIMNGGRIAQVGPPLDVYNAPADTFVAAFLGNPAMNLVPATVLEGDDGRRLRVGTAELVLPAARTPALTAGRTVTFGIRPEHVRPDESGAAAGRLVGEIAAVEQLGAETLTAVAVDGLGTPILARLSGQSHLALGSRLALALDLGRAHLFDERGHSLTHPSVTGV